MAIWWVVTWSMCRFTCNIATAESALCMKETVIQLFSAKKTACVLYSHYAEFYLTRIFACQYGKGSIVMLIQCICDFWFLFLFRLVNSTHTSFLCTVYACFYTPFTNY